jgi:hypothetical protein
MTGRTLFAIGVHGHGQETQEHVNKDYIILLNDVTRLLPERRMEAWPRASK